MLYKFKLYRTFPTLVALSTTLLLLFGCGSEQYDQLTDSQFESKSASHSSSKVDPPEPSQNTQSSQPSNHPSNHPSNQPSPSSPPQIPIQPSISTPSPIPTTVTQPTSTKKSLSPFNLEWRKLPAYAYNWKKDQDGYGYPYYFDRCIFPEEDKNPNSTYLTYGTMLDELFQVRELIRSHYVFREEVIDLDPREFVKPFSDFDSHYKNMTDKDSYFQQLRSKVKREDGLPRHDMFEYSKETDWTEYWKNYYARKKTYSFGITWDKRSENPPREFLVKFVNFDSPGLELLNGEPKVKRGDKLIKINDIEFVSDISNDSVEKIESGLNPDSRSAVTKFELIDRDSKQLKTVFLNPTSSQKSITEFSVIIETNSGPVGYINIGNSVRRFDRIYESIKEFKDNKVNDVVIDIRYYSRREDIWYYSKAEPMLLYAILGKENTEGKKFRYVDQKSVGLYSKLEELETPFISECRVTTKESQQKEFCDESMMTIDPSCPGNLPYVQSCGTRFYDFDLKTLDLNKVYLLTSQKTCHIGELIINALIGIDVEVIQIGEQTCGSPYLPYYRDNCGISYGILATRFLNDKREGDYIKGFKPKNTKSEYGVENPGCFVQDDFSQDLGDEQEAMLAAALKYRKDGTCPEVP